MTRRATVLTVLVLLVLGASSAQGAATFIINNVDPPGVGFNDPTPAVPVGGNPGLTVGAQRLNAFQFAADLWGAVLDSSVDIVIQGTFSPLFCDPNSAVLGAAGTIQIFANFPGAQYPATWYHSALANKLGGADLTPGPPDPGLLVPPFNDDIVAFFNGAIAGDPNCLGGATWYYGYDNSPPPGQIDLLNVLMHEFGHGIGFANFISEPAGTGPLGLPDIYTVFSRDNTQNKQWNQMTNLERAASAVNTGNVVWNGPNVVAAAPGVLVGVPVVRINAPAGIAGDFAAQSATYGAPLKIWPAADTADVALYDDGVGPDPNDACDLFLDPGVAGKIALINRGSCNFSLKSALAQLSGATGVIITNNQPVGLPPMGGSDLVAPTIASVGISKDDGDLIKANLPGVNASLTRDAALGLAGADAAGFVRLYAPNPVQSGSSISHWDTVADPNLLMEPFINADLTAATDLDLTPYQLADIGWELGPHCPVGSDDSATVVIDGCDSGVTNLFGPFTTFPVPLSAAGIPAGDVNGGCYLADLVNSCASAANHGEYTSCVTTTTNYLVSIGVISPAESASIQACAAAASIP